MSQKKGETIFSPALVHGDIGIWAARNILKAFDFNRGTFLAQISREKPIRAFDISQNKNCLAVGDDDKCISLYCLSSWNLIREWKNQQKKITSVRFVQRDGEERLIYGDRYGDVREISLSTPEEGENKNFQQEDLKEQGGEDKVTGSKLLLGHLCSSISSLDSDTKYLISADCDEKIRVSSLAHPHVTRSFCLGHTEFISSVKICPSNSSRLVSSSADATVRLWDISEGTPLAKADLSQSGPIVRMNFISCNGNSMHFVVLCQDFPGFINVTVNVHDNSISFQEVNLEQSLVPLNVLVFPKLQLSNKLLNTTVPKGQEVEEKKDIAFPISLTGQLCSPVDLFTGEKIGELKQMLEDSPAEACLINLWRWRGEDLEGEELDYAKKKRKRLPKGVEEPPSKVAAEN